MAQEPQSSHWPCSSALQDSQHEVTLPLRAPSLTPPCEECLHGTPSYSVLAPLREFRGSAHWLCLFSDL